MTADHSAEHLRARLAAIVDASRDAIVNYAIDGTITGWNGAAQIIYGYRAEEAIGRPISMLSSDASEFVTGVEIRHRETLHRRHDGTAIDIVLTLWPVRDDRGLMLGTVAIAHDATLRHKLDAERVRAAGLVTQSADAIISIDLQGHITSWNPAAAQLFGYSETEAVGRHTADLIAGADPEAAASIMARILDGYVGRYEAQRRHRDGRMLTVEISATPLRAPDGSITGALGTMRDISAARATEASLTQAAAREVALVHELDQTRRLESVGQLAGGIAHDFNNLLGVIINCAAFAAEHLPADSPARADIDEIEQASRRAAALTRQLLIFSRREVIQTETLDLGTITADLEGFLRRALGEQVELQVIGAQQSWPIEADRGQIEQLLVNLAINARDAMPAGGRLVIETSNDVLDDEFVAAHVGLSPGRYVRLTISDTGIGMSDEVIQHAFDPFFTTKPTGEGTGLGLATAYGIVSDAGGRISLYSEIGCGTSVKIHLPASNHELRRAQPVVAVAPAGRGELLLLVEDEPAVRRLTGRILTRAGYRVESVASGAEGLQRARSGSFDAVITDVVMPHMTGPDMVDAIRTHDPTMKAMLMSGYSHKVLTFDKLQGDARTAFIEKPFTADELRRRIRSLLDGSSHP